LVTIDKYRGGHGKASSYKDDDGRPKINNIFHLISLVMASHSRQQHHMELMHIYHRITGSVMMFLRESPIKEDMEWDQYMAMMFVSVFHHMESTPIDVGAFISLLQITEYVAVTPVTHDQTFAGNVTRKFASYRDMLLRAPSSSFLVSVCDDAITKAASGTTTYLPGRPKKGQGPAVNSFTRSISIQTGSKNPFIPLMADTTDPLQLMLDTVTGEWNPLNNASRRLTVANGLTTRVLGPGEIPVSRIFATINQFRKRPPAEGALPIPELTPHNARVMVPRFICEIISRVTHSHVRGPMEFMNIKSQHPRRSVIGPVRPSRDSVYRLYGKYARSDVSFFNEIELTDDEIMAYIAFYGSDEVISAVLTDPYVPQRVRDAVKNIRATPAKYMISM
jgi:hypothetical protein